MFLLQIATRKAYGTALAKLGRYNDRVVVLDADTNNLTYSEIFKNEHPNRFVECYVAQQNMVCILTSPVMEIFKFTEGLCSTTLKVSHLKRTDSD